MKLVFATHNPHKTAEVTAILSGKFHVQNLSDLGCHTDIPETADTIEENASMKSRYVFDHYHVDCFADDSGLEIEALGGAPGVYSARYAGESKNSEDNMQKVLRQLEGETNRKARFRTVISLMLDGKEYQFEGIVNGVITHRKHGEGGFGYDPIFRPDGYELTFAELGDDIKNRISHRAIAIDKLCQFLQSHS